MLVKKSFLSKKSVYVCGCCKIEKKSSPGKRIVCTACRVVMVEVNKGVITK